MIETIQSTAVASVSGAHTRAAQMEKIERNEETKAQDQSAAFDGTVTTSVDSDVMTISSAGAAFNENSAGSDGQSASSDLSGYTETELLQMLNQSEITRGEYEEEIASRTASATEESTQID